MTQQPEDGGCSARPAASSRVRWRPLVFLLALWISAWAPAPAAAHDLEFSYTVVVLRTDGTYQVDVTCDLDAIALGVAQGVDSAQVVRLLRQLPPGELDVRTERARDVVTDRVRIRFDGQAAQADLLFPGDASQPAGEPRVPTILGLTARFTGPIPPTAGHLTIEVDRSLPPVYLTVVDQRADRTEQQVLQRGAESEPYPLRLEVPFVPPSRLTVARQYVVLGFWHIVPEGLDHMLFVLGLFLLSATLRPLLFQVSAFTIAHTMTLALSSYGVLRLPSSVVEPLIALSIAYVAVENLFTRRLTRWRPLVVFAFGLLHGMGFAGVLGELGLPRDEFLPALLSFNAGVELGQIGVLAAAFLSIGQLRNHAWYRARITVPLSLLIAAVGLFWAIQRGFFV